MASSNIDFNGIMDDFYLYDIALTAAEINQVQSSLTGIGEVKNNSLTIYPNPVTRNSGFQINYDFTATNKPDIKIEIINSLGEISGILKPIQSPVKLAGLSKSGLYLIRLIAGNKTIYTGKLLVI